jgi:hypothetical protein
MADYYPLIARAISGLDPSAPGESRRALYERARAALIAQLRSVQPELKETEITRERLSLEEAVRKVESEAAQRARDATRTGGLSRGQVNSAPQAPGMRGFRDIAADADDLHRAIAQAVRAAQKTYANVPSRPRPPTPPQARNERPPLGQEPHRQEPRQQPRNLRADAPPKRFADSFQSRDALAAQAKRHAEAAQARADKERREEEERAENERREQLQRLSEIERATREQLEALRRREEHAARIQNDARRLLAREQLAMVASPAPSLAPDGRLDAGPNTVYDAAQNSDDLPTLPLRQRAIIKTILSDLPGNSPKYLKTSLQSYEDELEVRGAQPILGLLKDMFEIIDAAVGDPSAQQDWLGPGLRKAFEKVAVNHHTLVSHFPLDPERENLYARTLVEENEATGNSLSEPFRQVAQATQNANEAGLTTDDFLRITDKMAEFAKIISTLPLSAPPSGGAPRSPHKFGAQIVVIRPEDRIGESDPPISARKRILLTGLGFFERVYNLLGSTVTIVGTPEGLALLRELKEAISALLNFVRH